MNKSAISPVAAASGQTSWAWTIGTFFGIGMLRPGPGTWASATTVLLWWLLSLAQLSHSGMIAGAVVIVVTAIGIPAATHVARESGIHDPGFIVIDEVGGQMLPLIIAPLRWKYLLLSFILFRCFDILKPPPLRALERLPQGSGIMLDDIGAGIYALSVLGLVLKFWG